MWLCALNVGMTTFLRGVTGLKHCFYLMALAVIVALVAVPVRASEPPEWALHLDSFLRSQDAVANDQALLDQSRAAGASEVDIGVAVMLRSLRSADDELFLSGWNTLGGSEEKLRQSEFLKLLASDDDETFGVFSGTGKALSLRAGGDFAGYRATLLDLVWEFPGFADLIMSWEAAQREKERIANLRLPMDLPLPSTDGGEVTLGQLMEGNKALLLDFHASWCGACMAALAAIDEKIPVFKQNGVLLVGINTESPADARAVKQRFGLEVPWLAEPEGQPLKNLLQLRGVPTYVLVKPDGTVAFMDNFLNEELDAQIAALQ